MLYTIYFWLFNWKLEKHYKQYRKGGWVIGSPKKGCYGWRLWDYQLERWEFPTFWHLREFLIKNGI